MLNEKQNLGLQFDLKWQDVHPFERIGVVLEYFHQSGLFDKLRAEPTRGLIKNDDDPFISKNAYSCPLFIISGEKIK